MSSKASKHAHNNQTITSNGGAKNKNMNPTSIDPPVRILAYKFLLIVSLLKHTAHASNIKIHH